MAQPKISDLTDDMEALTEAFRRAKDAGTLKAMTLAEVTTINRSFATLCWAMREAFEASSETRQESYGSVTTSNPFTAFTKNLWRTENDAGELRDALAERRRSQKTS